MMAYLSVAYISAIIRERIETIKKSQQLIMEMAFQSGSAREVVENLKTKLMTSLILTSQK